MEELIKVIYDNDRITVSARDLYGFLEIKTEFAKWMQRMCEYGFTEHVDYEVIVKNDENSKGGRPATDYQLTIDMAKEISMIQRNDKGKQARKYFIECEKRLKNQNQFYIPQTYADALRLAAEQTEKVVQLQLENKEITKQVEELKPKASYCDEILQSQGCMLVTQIAKDYGLTPHRLNRVLHDLHVQYKVGTQWVLYSEHDGNGYVESDTTYYKDDYGMSHAKVTTKWTQKGRLFIYNLLKDNAILPLVEQA